MAFVDGVLPVTVDLASGYANENGDHDTISDVENVLGSEYGDHIYGDDGPNVLDGWEGGDHIYGRGGIDDLRGGDGDDVLDGGGDADTILDGEGNDTLIGGDGDDTCSPTSATISSRAAGTMTLSPAARDRTLQATRRPPLGSASRFGCKAHLRTRSERAGTSFRASRTSPAATSPTCCSAISSPTRWTAAAAATCWSAMTATTS